MDQGSPPQPITGAPTAPKGRKMKNNKRSAEEMGSSPLDKNKSAKKSRARGKIYDSVRDITIDSHRELGQTSYNDRSNYNAFVDGNHNQQHAQNVDFRGHDRRQHDLQNTHVPLQPNLAPQRVTTAAPSSLGHSFLTHAPLQPNLAPQGVTIATPFSLGHSFLAARGVPFAEESSASEASPEKKNIAEPTFNYGAFRPLPSVPSAENNAYHGLGLSGADNHHDRYNPAYPRTSPFPLDQRMQFIPPNYGPAYPPPGSQYHVPPPGPQPYGHLPPRQQQANSHPLPGQQSNRFPPPGQQQNRYPPGQQPNRFPPPAQQPNNVNTPRTNKFARSESVRSGIEDPATTTSRQDSELIQSHTPNQQIRIVTSSEQSTAAQYIHDQNQQQARKQQESNLQEQSGSSFQDKCIEFQAARQRGTKSATPAAGPNIADEAASSARPARSLPAPKFAGLPPNSDRHVRPSAAPAPANTADLPPNSDRHARPSAAPASANTADLTNVSKTVKRHARPFIPSPAPSIAALQAKAAGQVHSPFFPAPANTADLQANSDGSAFPRVPPTLTRAEDVGPDFMIPRPGPVESDPVEDLPNFTNAQLNAFVPNALDMQVMGFRRRQMAWDDIGMILSINGAEFILGEVKARYRLHCAKRALERSSSVVVVVDQAAAGAQPAPAVTNNVQAEEQHQQHVAPYLPPPAKQQPSTSSDMDKMVEKIESERAAWHLEKQTLQARIALLETQDTILIQDFEQRHNTQQRRLVSVIEKCRNEQALREKAERELKEEKSENHRRALAQASAVRRAEGAKPDDASKSTTPAKKKAAQKEKNEQSTETTSVELREDGRPSTGGKKLSEQLVAMYLSSVGKESNNAGNEQDEPFADAPELLQQADITYFVYAVMRKQWFIDEPEPEDEGIVCNQYTYLNQANAEVTNEVLRPHGNDGIVIDVLQDRSLHQGTDGNQLAWAQLDVPTGHVKVWVERSLHTEWQGELPTFETRGLINKTVYAVKQETISREEAEEGEIVTSTRTTTTSEEAAEIYTTFDLANIKACDRMFNLRWGPVETASKRLDDIVRRQDARDTCKYMLEDLEESGELFSDKLEKNGQTIKIWVVQKTVVGPRN
jgi:hypothetical protein